MLWVIFGFLIFFLLLFFPAAATEFYLPLVPLGGSVHPVFAASVSNDNSPDSLVASANSHNGYPSTPFWVQIGSWLFPSDAEHSTYGKNFAAFPNNFF